MGQLTTRDAVRFAVIAVAVLLAWGALNRLTSWLPWSTASQLERAKDARDRYQGEAVVSRLETEGERASAERVHQTHTIIIQAERAAHEAVRNAYQAEDADVPLDAARADRLRANDARLCAIIRLDGCPADGDAGPGR